jgi:hypothetical protein
MRLTERYALGIGICIALLLLAWGFWKMIDIVPLATPYGYGAGGIGIVMVAAYMGVVFVLLLLMLIAWFRTPSQPDARRSVSHSKPNLWKYWAILVICGSAGPFWTVVGIARVWHWIDIIIGAAAMVVACAAAYQVSRALQLHQ